MLNHRDSTPLYVQLKQDLSQQMDRGRLKPGQPIPSERSLCETYRVSRTTVRQALSEMINAGLLSSKQGKGTFVAERKVNQGLVRFVNFERVGDMLYLSRRTKMTLRLPRERVANALQLSGNTLMVAGNPIKVGEGKVKLLSNTSTLYARFVVSLAGESEEAFLSRVVQELREDGLKFKKVIAGKENLVCSNEGLLVTRSLMVGDLKPADSVALQEAGLGSHRKLGCGLFIPHKTV